MRLKSWLLIAALGGVSLPGCGGVPESALHEDELVSVSISVSAKGRPVELDSIAVYTPTGEGVTSELPSAGTIATRLIPGTYKVTAIPAATSAAAAKVVTATYQNPAETPWEIVVSSDGGTFDLKVE